MHCDYCFTVSSPVFIGNLTLAVHPAIWAASNLPVFRTLYRQTQDIIDSKLDKRRKGVLGPPLGMTCVIFVDDLNMPAKETYGAQPPIEILRQWMDHGGWYDRKENTFRQLVDVQFVAAMGPPGGGRTSITQRYVRHFNLLNFVPFSNDSLQRVFGTILDWFLQRGFNSTVKQVCRILLCLGRSH